MAPIFLRVVLDKPDHSHQMLLKLGYGDELKNLLLSQLAR